MADATQDLHAQLARARAENDLLTRRIMQLEAEADRKAASAGSTAAAAAATAPIPAAASSSPLPHAAAAAPAFPWSHQLTPAQISRYSRQLILSELGGADTQARLLRTRVLVVGAGG